MRLVSLIACDCLSPRPSGLEQNSTDSLARVSSWTGQVGVGSRWGLGGGGPGLRVHTKVDQTFHGTFEQMHSYERD